MKRQQLSLFKTETQYGGDYNKGKAKTYRPLSTKKPLHVTLRSSRAVGDLALSKNRGKIQKILGSQATRWGIRIYKYSINSNHIHLVLLGKSREGIRNFFRSFAGLVARAVTKAERGKRFGKFWDRTLWSRVAYWGEAFHALKGYVVRNVLESRGVIPYDRSLPTTTLLRL